MTGQAAQTIVLGMEEKENNPLELEIEVLEAKIGELTELYRRVLEENRSLRASQETLNSERASLLEKNEQAKGRVEAMIRRLKSMEQNG